jgi:RNA polymerase sigma-70 factor (ECF subfamily)
VLLARRAREGDMARFNELCERLMPALYGWACLRIAPAARGRVDPQEVVQETWVRALRRFEEFDERRASFRNWVFGIAKNVLLEAFRAAKDESSALGGPAAPVFSLDALPDSVTTVSHRVAREESLQRFLATVGALGSDETQLVLLCGLEGWTCKDAAQRLSITEEAAKKRWQRLRAEIATRDLPRDLLA